ncbi:MAG: DEAD/DEAH box helicase family protein [Planctomycetaceae bacterium]
MIVTLPPLFRIDANEKGNSIRLLSVPSWTGTATVEPFGRNRVRGFSVQAESAAPPVLVITNSAQPPPDVTHIIRARGQELPATTDKAVDLSDASWIKHPQQAPAPTTRPQYEKLVSDIRTSWQGGFVPKREDARHDIAGLRPPQIGAIYAVQSHWTVHSDLATVVLPTGVGKTETMLSLLVAEQCPRLLVVVPTDALRTQLSEKFITLGLLKNPRFGVILDSAQYPIVGTLSHRPSTPDQVDALFRKCNVIVTTMPLAGQCSEAVQARMAELCPCLFIDEAHHVAAPTWKKFTDAFKQSRIVQFTATPFRNDDRPIGGRRLFAFSLRQAQEQGYFTRIHFKPVMEFAPERKDAVIADAAVKQLRADAAHGHILMARVANIPRAEQVFECYRGYAEFNPVQIHTGIKSQAERERIRRQLLSGESRIVVCVDMLGEGFDLPELKIAALHDIRKSLAVTLQLAGRFTRAKPTLGDATFVANVADLDVKDELRRLYQHDSDWNMLLPVISENAIDTDFNLCEFLRGFQELPEELTLGNVRPAMSTVVYRTNCGAWTPEKFADGIAGYKNLDKVYSTLNPQENTLVIVTTRRVPVDWAQIDEIHNWDWQLYVLNWSRDQNLLFIHNSNNAGFFKKLAEAVAGEVQQVRGPEVFRCLANINRLKLQNVGLLEQLGRLIRYTMRAGSDVEPGMSVAQKNKAIKSNLFGQGFEGGHRTTIGCSYKGRIWSYKTTNLLELTKWTHAIGSKLNDPTLNPDDVLEGTLRPTLIGTRPTKVPITVEWPDIFYREPESVFTFTINGTNSYPHNSSLVLINPDDQGPLKFALVSENVQAGFELELFTAGTASDYRIRATDEAAATIRHRGRSMPLQEFLDEEPPTLWFADGSSLTGAELVELRRTPDPFPKDYIEPWDWTGTNIRVESQTISRDSKSIQYRVIQELKKNPAFTVIFDDDDHGESADVVAIAEESDHIAVQFWHCKYANADRPGARIAELYEICGQAQKCVRWLEKQRDLFTHLMRRSPRSFKKKQVTRYEIGSEQDLLRIRGRSEMQRVHLSVVIIQPGLSKAAVSSQQLELLAVTENYLKETFAVPFRVIASP